jgi:hypothetical protein
MRLRCGFGALSGRELHMRVKEKKDGEKDASNESHDSAALPNT